MHERSRSSGSYREAHQGLVLQQRDFPVMSVLQVSFPKKAVPVVVVVLLVLARLVALLVLGNPWGDEWEQKIFYSDTNSYLYAADEISDGVQNKPLFRVPGYPLLILGTRDLIEPRWLATILLNLAADCLTAMVVIAMTGRLLGRVAGFWTGAYYLLLPSCILYSIYVIPDVITACLIAVSGLLWLETTPESRPGTVVRNGLLAGLCFGAAMLLKPVVLYAPAVYLALVFIPKREGWANRACFAVAVLFLSTGTYMILRSHNQRSFGLPGVSTQDAFELMGRAVQMADYRGLGEGGEDFWHFRDSLVEVASQGGAVNWGMRDSLFRMVTREALLANPLRVAYLEFTRWPKFFVNLDGHKPYLGITDANEKPFVYVAITSLLQVPLGIALLMAVTGRKLRSRLKRHFWLGIAWFAYSVPVIGPIASFRYGLMFYWALVPFAAAAFGFISGFRPSAQEQGRSH